MTNNPENRKRSWHSRRRLTNIINSLSPKEDSYTRRKNEAINEFRKQARYSFIHNQVTHCYSKLEDAQKYQTINNINQPIWDAIKQEYVK